jgi:hypothetical protein
MDQVRILDGRDFFVADECLRMVAAKQGYRILQPGQIIFHSLTGQDVNCIEIKGYSVIRNNGRSRGWEAEGISCTWIYKDATSPIWLKEFERLMRQEGLLT